MKVLLSVSTFAALVALSSVPLHAKIGALGHIIPAGDIVSIAGPAEAVAKVYVKAGDVVEAGAPLVTFSGEGAAKEGVEVALLDLKEADDVGRLQIEAQMYKVANAKADYDFAKTRHDRFANLGGEDASPQQMEQRAYQMKGSELTYNAAAKDLERAKMDRDIKVEKAKKALDDAKAKLNQTTLRAPARMTVVKIDALPGFVTAGPIVSLADLTQIQVLTEVFAGDLPKLKLGQTATITGTALSSNVTGKVISIGRIISGRAKVADVLIRLDDPKEASGLLELEVNVSIDE